MQPGLETHVPAPLQTQEPPVQPELPLHEVSVNPSATGVYPQIPAPEQAGFLQIVELHAYDGLKSKQVSESYWPHTL
jgi:hypothetical protein